MKTKHTPGPWQMNPNNHQEILADGRTPDNTVVAIVPVGQPDAHLIAAAPEMLAALEVVYEHLAKVKAPGELHIQIANAINKAKGKND